MPNKVYTADFKTLRSAYAEVKAFLEAERWDNEIISLKTTIEGDLGLAGDDNYELLEKFVDKYELDPGKFDYSKHFLCEGELFSHKAFLFTLIFFPVWIVEKLSFGKLEIYPHNFFEQFYRPTTDLTFRDMVQWYLTKTYTPSENLSIKLAYN
ncbi:MAG: DUF1493 family protein [Flavobacterium sp.]